MITYFHLYYRNFLLIGQIEQALSKYIHFNINFGGSETAFDLLKNNNTLNLICSLNVLEIGRDLESPGRQSCHSALFWLPRSLENIIQGSSGELP